MLGLAAVAVLGVLAAVATQFLAWGGAVLNTPQLPDETWFVVVLTGDRRPRAATRLEHGSSRIGTQRAANPGAGPSRMTTTGHDRETTKETNMRSLVVYESLWGNTEQAAHAIAAGLGDAMTVDVVEVGAAPTAPTDGVDLLVVGGPTHAFSMSRPDTRSEAVTRGASNTAAGQGIREWIAALPTVNDGPLVATFDTRVDKVRRLPGSAARKAGKLLRRRGYAQVLDPESFYVADVAGPLLEGEMDRARAWGGRLGDAAREGL